MRPGRAKRAPGDPPVGARTAAWTAALAGALSAAAWLLIAMPAVYVAWYCLARIGAEGFGAAWAGASLGAYLSGYLLNGWSAAGTLSGAYGIDPAGALLAVA